MIHQLLLVLIFFTHISPVIGASSCVVTVFIHGSIGSNFVLLNPFQAWRDDIQGSLYESVVREIRDTVPLFENQIIDKEGLQPLELPTFLQEETRAATPFLVSAYDRIARSVSDSDEVRLYYAFGHSGLLSQQYRYQSAQQLYEELLSLKNDLNERYQKISFHLVAHSHGGNIALNLARCEAESKGGLQVDFLCMLATPIQKETAVYAQSDLFGRVINVYDQYDLVQLGDIFSTACHRSYNQFSSPAIQVSGPKVSDVRALVGGKSGVIDHANIFQLGRSVKGIYGYAPFPLMIFISLLLDQLQSLPAHSVYDWNLINNAGEEDFYFQLSSCQEIEFFNYSSKNLATVINKELELVQQYWKPVDKSKSPIFNINEYKESEIAYAKLRFVCKQFCDVYSIAQLYKRWKKNSK